MAKRRNANQNSGANLGFEEKFWAALDKQRLHERSDSIRRESLGLARTRDKLLSALLSGNRLNSGLSRHE